MEKIYSNNMYVTNINHDLPNTKEYQKHGTPLSATSHVHPLFIVDNLKKFDDYTSNFFSVAWLVVLRIYVPLAIFQQYCDLEAGDNRSLKL